MLFGHRSVQLQLGQVSVQPGQPLLRIYAERAAELEGDGLDEKVHADIGVCGRGAGQIGEKHDVRIAGEGRGELVGDDDQSAAGVVRHLGQYARHARVALGTEQDHTVVRAVVEQLFYAAGVCVAEILHVPGILRQQRPQVPRRPCQTAEAGDKDVLTLEQDAYDLPVFFRVVLAVSLLQTVYGELQALKRAQVLILLQFVRHLMLRDDVFFTLDDL